MAGFAARQLVASGACELRINASHLASQVETFAGELAAELTVDVSCYFEPELLGTAGGISAMQRSRRTTVVWNGDIFAPDLSLEWVNERAHPTPTLVVSPVSAAQKPHVGTVGLDAQGNVVRLRGEQFGVEHVSADYVGVAVLPPAFTSQLPRVGCLIADGILPWLRAGNRVGSQTFDGYWSDGGTFGEYLRQNRFWLQRKHVANHVAPGAVCASGIELFESVVGKGAQLAGRGAVKRTVVLPGARATAPLSDAIVVADGRVIQLPEEVS